MKDSLVLPLAILCCLSFFVLVQTHAEDKSSTTPSGGKVVKVGNAAPADAVLKSLTSALRNTNSLRL